MAGQRVGLLIANSEFADPSLQQLPAAPAELEALANLLSRSEIGNFKIKMLVNEPRHTIQDALETFLRTRTAEDFVLVYFAGHGIRNDRGQLFFTTTDTRRTQLVSTAFGAEHFAHELRQCRAGRKILLLDCSFVSECASESRVPVEKNEWEGSNDFRVQGSVHAILSGSDAVQYEWAGRGPGERGIGPSRFTGLLIRGMQSGEADLNGDGLISVSEMGHYILRESRRLGSAQTARTWLSDSEQDLILATATRQPPLTALPEELGPLVESESVAVRLAVIDELKVPASDSESSLAAGARRAIERLTHDASQRVAEKAKQALATPSTAQRRPKDPSATEFGPPDPSASQAAASETRMTVPEPPQDQTSGDDATSPRDENVQFTAYRPASVRASRWYRLLVFTHLDGLDETEPDEPSPTEQMEEQARQMLGPDFPSYRDTGSESRYRIPRESEITFVPNVPGVEFHPIKRSFLWLKGLNVHPETFSFRARPELMDTIARGWISVYFGHLVLAEISLNVRVVRDEPVSPRSNRPGWERASVSPFRKVFVSYSHADADIVEATERYVRALGDEYLRDAANLRSGERWDERLFRFIDQADLFQLFWSANAARSAFVEREWRYALTLPREAFIRPTYWREPMPEPPAPLRHIHFCRLPFVHPAVQPPPAPASWNLSAPLERFDSQAAPLPAMPPERAQAEVGAPGRSAPRTAAPRPGPLPRVLAIVGFSFALAIGICVVELRPANRVSSPGTTPQPLSAPAFPEPTPSASPSATARSTPSFDKPSPSSPPSSP
jgi:TIR domain/Caspase domain